LPKQCRELRRTETRKAEREAITTFSSNLRNILLTAPVRGETVLGIDPGFTHGCKLAVVDPTGRILDTSVVYLKGKNSAEVNLQRIINSNKCTVIAIGNGKGSRESEELVSQLIQSEKLWRKDISFCVINEAGASIYSVSNEAQKEMPSLDPNLRSAVSIARRLQDPMAELVKIDPKHIGVGLYQHDMPQKLLDEAVNAVVEDAVSFVGVDLNACSEALLCRVAGMSEKKAKAVIEYRNTQGLFVNRSQLRNVKGIGEKTFQQCAGFLRIHQSSSSCVVVKESQAKIEKIPGDGRSRKRKGNTLEGTASKRKKESEFELQPLDETNIHPESYEATMKWVSLFALLFLFLLLPYS
jgi:competence ComEA-like helix-hairpin-helix protein